MSTSASNPPTPTPPPLPTALQPQNLDTLPHITHLLLRLQAHINTHPSNPASTPLPSLQPISSSKDITPLSTKEFSLACDELRQRLRRARAAVKELEGVNVTIEEQEVELEALEAKIVEQRRALSDLQERSRRVVGRIVDGVGTQEEMDVS